MKKIMLYLSSLLLIMSGCSNEDPEKLNESNSGKVRWYGAKLIDEVETKGLADGAKRWNQDAGIYIKFLNEPSDSGYVEKVKQIASEWEEYAGIRFYYVDQHKKADVRIAFDWNDNDWLTWSYTGTDAKFERNQNNPTAVLAGLDYLNDDELKGDILRLFGQILGLEYEQRHQKWSENGYWKTETALQRYWEEQFEGYDMDWDEIREYVFEPLTEENAQQLYETKEIDELSIMAWPYYNHRQTIKLLANYELSEVDKEFIALLYPPRALPTIQEAWVDAGYFVWTDDSKTRLRLTELGRQQEYLPDVSDGEQLTSAEEMFISSISGLIEPPELKNAPKFNTSNITNFVRMFEMCSSLTSIPQFDTSSGTDFNCMFFNCESLTTVPLLDTSSGTNFESMFSNCLLLTNIPMFDTSNGTDFSYMFGMCRSLTAIPSLNTSNGTDFSYMFYNCSSLTIKPELDLSNAIGITDMYTGTPFE